MLDASIDLAKTVRVLRSRSRYDPQTNQRLTDSQTAFWREM